MIKRLSNPALEVLYDYKGPGNIRALRHVNEGSILISGNGTLIASADLGLATKGKLTLNTMSKVTVIVEESRHHLITSVLRQ